MINPESWVAEIYWSWILS